MPNLIAALQWRQAKPTSTATTTSSFGVAGVASSTITPPTIPTPSPNPLASPLANFKTTIVVPSGSCASYAPDGINQIIVACSSTSTTAPSPSSTDLVKSDDVSATGHSQTQGILSPSNTSNSTANAVKSGGKSGVQGGAVAGVAIACLIGGAAIAAIVFFLLARRNKRRQATSFQNHLPYNGSPPGPEKGALVAASPMRGAISSNVDNFLPPPAEDNAIKTEVSKIRDNIKNHVRSYYHLETVAATQLEESHLAGLATATGMSTSALTGFFINPSTRGDAIRLFIAWVVMSRCSGSRKPTLLPDELSSLAITVSGKDGTNAAQAALFSKWKTITGALLNQRYGKKAQNESVPSRSVAEAIAELNTFLALFVVGSVEGGQRHRNLEMIMSRSAQLAFLLFSQPGSFHFDFTSQNGVMVVFPALLQVVGDQAETLSPPKILWPKEFAAVEML